MDGIQLIRIERSRQKREEHYTVRHDLSHDRAELARAAAVYAMPEDLRAGVVLRAVWPQMWSYKPVPDDRIKELTKAGALIAAELDRLLAEI